MILQKRENLKYVVIIVKWRNYALEN